MSYVPEPSSVAARVIAFLKAKPEGYLATNAELSHQLGVPASSFAGCLTSAVNAGLVHKRWHDIAGGRSTIAWVLGPRVVEPAGLPQEPDHEPPPALETVTTVLAMTRRDSEPTDPVVAEVKALLERQETLTQAPADEAESFACALFNDGRLYLELGAETMTLQVEHTRALLAYLERVAMP